MVHSYGAVHNLYVGARLSGGNSTWWVKWDVTQDVSFFAVAFDANISVFYNIDVVFYEYCGAIVVSELVDGDE